MAKYKDINREQLFFLPSSIDKLIVEDHVARYMWDILDQFDLSPFDKDYKNDDSGRPAIKPKNLLAILLYSYSKGIRSSRSIEEKCKTDLVYMYLAEMQKPDHSTIAAFRTEHKTAMKEIFGESIFLGIESGLIDLKHLAGDGSKIKSAGSKSQIQNAEKIEERLESCKILAEELISDSEKEDNKEQKSKTGNKIRKIKNKLDRLKRAKATLDNLKDKPKRVHLTELEAKLMKDKDGFLSGYNAQSVADSKSQMIVESYVVTDENDQAQGKVLRQKLLDRFGSERLSGTTLSLDNGYSNIDFIQLDGKDGIHLLISQHAENKELRNVSLKAASMTYDEKNDCFICKNGHVLNFYRMNDFSSHGKTRMYKEYRTNKCRNCPFQKDCFKDESKNHRQKSKMVTSDFTAEQHENQSRFIEKMQQEESRNEYRKRSSTIEPVFGHMTYHRKADRFMTWGFDHVNTEYTMMSLLHNILKLVNYSKLALGNFA